MPRLVDLSAGTASTFGAPGFGCSLEGEQLEPFASLHALRDMLWAVYEQDGAWRLHVSSGFEVRLNGRVTGGGALQTGDVLDGGQQLLRFVDAEWPGDRLARLDAQTLASAEDDSLALVYRDWALEHGAPIAEALRRPVPRAEQARHLFALARQVASGVIDAHFAGPFVRRVVVRDPDLELTGFVDALSRCARGTPHLHVVRTVGLSNDDGAQLALLLARAPALAGLTHLEAGHRGAWTLADFRDVEVLETAPRRVPTLSSPREGPARPVMLELVEWDGWTPVEPLTRQRWLVLEADTSLVPLDDGGALSAFDASAPVSLLRRDDWVLQVLPSVPKNLQPSWSGEPLFGKRGVGLDEVFELIPGLRCRLRPAR
ncbi:MAG: hypothetical protein Q8N26_11765 [Myxococcales bacterium]|nr:hypothetical protein [Myxococcales bacterium]